MMRLIAAILLALLISCSCASSAQFRVIPQCSDPGCGYYLYIIGKIENGDGERAREAIRKAGPLLETVFLRSPGGSMYDSIAIGSLLSQLWVNTSAPYYAGHCERDDTMFGVYNAPCTCVSGCFLIWMGGVNRYGVIVGMHRPFDFSGSMGRLNYEAAAPTYKKWIQDLTDYLEKMELPQSYVGTFVSTVRSDNMHMLSGAELLGLNNMPSKSERLTNRCGQWSTPENNELGTLETAKYQGQYYDSVRLSALEGRLTRIQSCKSAAQAEERKSAYKRLFSE